MMIGLIAMLGALGGVADDGPYKTYDGGWNLYRNDDNCALVGNYEGDVVLYIVYYPKRNSVGVTVIDPKFKEVEDGGRYIVDLHFQDGDEITDTWNLIAAKGRKIDGLGPGFSFGVSGEDFLTDFGKYRVLRLAIVGNFKTEQEALTLDKQVAPLDGLRTCAVAVN